MSDKEFPARIIVGLVVLAILCAGLLLLISLSQEAQVRSFDECRDRGYPVMESDPERCMYNGETFVNQDRQ